MGNNQVWQGNDLYPIEEPYYYVEYLPDSVLRYHYKDGRTENHKYWIADSLLYKQETWYLFEGGEIDTLVWTYEYQFDFKNYNKLKVRVVNWIMEFDTELWERKR